MAECYSPIASINWCAVVPLCRCEISKCNVMWKTAMNGWIHKWVKWMHFKVEIVNEKTLTQSIIYSNENSNKWIDKNKVKWRSKQLNRPENIAVCSLCLNFTSAHCRRRLAFIKLCWIVVYDNIKWPKITKMLFSTNRYHMLGKHQLCLLETPILSQSRCIHRLLTFCPYWPGVTVSPVGCLGRTRHMWIAGPGAETLDSMKKNLVFDTANLVMVFASILMSICVCWSLIDVYVTISCILCLWHRACKQISEYVIPSYFHANYWRHWTPRYGISVFMNHHTWFLRK